MENHLIPTEERADRDMVQLEKAATRTHLGFLLFPSGIGSDNCSLACCISPAASTAHSGCICGVRLVLLLAGVAYDAPHGGIVKKAWSWRCGHGMSDLRHGIHTLIRLPPRPRLVIEQLWWG